MIVFYLLSSNYIEYIGDCSLFVDIVDDQLAAGDPTYDSGDTSINITNLTENKSFVATFDASAKTWTVE